MHRQRGSLAVRHVMQHCKLDIDRQLASIVNVAAFNQTLPAITWREQAAGCSTRPDAMATSRFLLPALPPALKRTPEQQEGGCTTQLLLQK